MTLILAGVLERRGFRAAVAALILLAMSAPAALAAEDETAASSAPAASSPPAQTEAAKGPLLQAWKWFKQGGPVMYPIAIASLIGIAFVIERAAALRRRIALPEELKEELLRRVDGMDVDGALAECDARPCPLGRVVRAGLSRRSGSLQEMEKAAEDAGIREVWHMRQNIRAVGIVGAIAPLLGLLGTVTGMMSAFDAMSKGTTMGDPAAFAGAIHEALYTTFFGLTVAIPMLLCHFWLYGRANSLMAEVEEVTGNLLLRLRDRRMQSETAQVPALRSPD